MSGFQGRRIYHLDVLSSVCYFFFKLYVYECFACVYVCVTCLPNTKECQKRALDDLDLELQVIVSHQVCAGN